MSPVSPRPATARTQADRLLGHCIYRIATGKWRAGDRLPSIRETRREWGSNQATVQSTYRRLVEMGLAESRPRSGYYVSGGSDLERLSRHRHELENLHRRVLEALRQGTELSALGALRYVTHLEEMRQAEEPEVAFVECTATQAEDHAAEISEHLRIPVLALTTGQLEGRTGRVPHFVRRLLTSPFHLEEVRALAHPPGRTVAAVPIEVSPEIAAGATGSDEIVLLEREDSMAAHIAEDAARLLPGCRVQTLLTQEPNVELERLLELAAAPPKRLILLSPRLWGEIDPAWRTDPRVRQVCFRVCSSAWPLAAEAAGLPLTV